MSAGPLKGDWCWRVNRENLVFHAEDDVTFVYNRLSGETHVLNLVSMALLEMVSGGPAPLDEIAEKFHVHIDVPRDECPPGVVRRMFGELDDVGLVELCPKGTSRA